jgi:hybrid cluster-associated redox disulfide protein
VIPPKADRGPVKRTSLIADVIETRPDAARVLFETWKLPCYDCEVSFHETIEQGASYYGIDPDEMVRRLEACPLGPEPVDEATPPPPAAT